MSIDSPSFALLFGGFFGSTVFSNCSVFKALIFCRRFDFVIITKRVKSELHSMTIILAGNPFDVSFRAAAQV
jgi:hypothetical protein